MATGSASHESLKQARRCGRPITRAVITPIMKADGEKEPTLHCSLRLCLFVSFLRIFDVFLRTGFVEGNDLAFANPERLGHGEGIILSDSIGEMDRLAATLSSDERPLRRNLFVRDQQAALPQKSIHWFNRGNKREA